MQRLQTTKRARPLSKRKLKQPKRDAIVAELSLKEAVGPEKILRPHFVI